MRLIPILAIAGLLATSVAAQAQISIEYAPVQAPRQDHQPVATGYAPQPAGERFTVQRPHVPAAPATTSPLPTAPPVVSSTTSAPLYAHQLAPTPAISHVPAAVSYAPASTAYYAPTAVPTGLGVIPANYQQPAGQNVVYRNVAYQVGTAGSVPTATLQPTLQPAPQYQPMQHQPMQHQPMQYQPVQHQAVQYQAVPQYGAPIQQMAYDPCTCTPVMNVSAYAPATGAYSPYAYTPTPPAMVAQSVPSYAWRPLLPLRSLPDEYYVGQGILGQPKVYAQGEPIRNFFRYIFP